MHAPAFNDRIEKKYQMGIDESDVAQLWRELGSFLVPHGLAPVQRITSVGSVYFDNKDSDLLRFSLLGHLMLLRTRAYELYGQTPEPIKEYWVEVKTANGPRRKKKRFRLSKSALLQFLDGQDYGSIQADRNDGQEVESEGDQELYRESQEMLLTMGLKPTLLVACKRIAFQGEVDRLSIDWDVKYYDAAKNIYDYSSWKYLAEPPAGQAGKVILELKCLAGDGVPIWFTELKKHYPIWEREYLKPVEGMGFLFQGPLKSHRQASHFRPLIETYLANSLIG